MDIEEIICQQCFVGEWAQAFFFLLVTSLPGIAVFSFVRSWSLARWLGWLAYSWVVWLAVSVGWIAFDAGAARAIFVVFLGAFLVTTLWRREKRGVWKSSWRLIGAQNVLFFALYFIFVLFRGVLPDFHYTDRLHDYGFIMSAFRSETFPPPDPFLAPERLNYYYYGHYLVALGAKLTGIRVELAFTFIAGFFFAATATLAFEIAKTVYRSLAGAEGNPARVAGVLSSYFVVFAGNLHPFFAKGLGNYWYPEATTMVPGTRMDFPFYSFVNNELHAHSLDLLNSLALLALISRLAGTANLPLRRNLSLLAAIALALGAACATHSWDFAIAGILLTLALWFGTEGMGPWHRLARLVTVGVGTGLGAFVLFLPFWVAFTPFGRGLALVPSSVRSSLLTLAAHWGPFLAIIAAWLVLARSRKLGLPPSVRALGALGVFLILFPEFFYVVDIHHDQPRFNTMWRCAYQGWVVLSCLAGPALVWLWRELRPRRWRWTLTIVPAAMAVYPVLTVATILQQEGAQLKPLAVTGKLRQKYPSDMAAIDWLAARPGPEQGIVAEACGDNYTDYSRVSALSGLPTILGWSNIAAQTRKASGSSPLRPKTAVEKITGGTDSIDQRIRDVEALYQATDPAEMRRIVARYRIRYIFVGTLERSRYPGLNEALLASLYGSPAFELGSTRVYATSLHRR